MRKAAEAGALTRDDFEDSFNNVPPLPEVNIII
jgi:hypothetical protein